MRPEVGLRYTTSRPQYRPLAMPTRTRMPLQQRQRKGWWAMVVVEKPAKAGAPTSPAAQAYTYADAEDATIGGGYCEASASHKLRVYTPVVLSADRLLAQHMYGTMHY